MAASPGDFENPEIPRNFREFYIIYHQDRLRSIQDSKKLEIIEQRQEEALTTQKTQEVRLDHLEGRVNSWNLINSLGVILASIMAAFGLKGS